MRLARRLEERLELLFRQQQLAGGLYRSLGQEGESVAAAYALGPGDWLSPSIRNLGALLVRGVSPKELFLLAMAKVDALNRGKDTTTHFNDPARGLLGPVSPLGATLCVLGGIALSFKMRRQPNVALGFLGDGASRTGAAHEAIAFAAAQRVPLVIVLENNGWAFGTRTSEEAALEDFVDMAPGYGIAGDQVDGNDVPAVYRAVKAAVDRARDGGGVTLIEAKTYRMRGHAQHDAQEYVPQDELEEWRARDPIARYARDLKGRGLATDADLEAIDRRVETELDAAVDEALARPRPDPEEALAGVYAGEAQPRPWTRA